MKIEKLYPECKDYIWGGEKLKTKYNKQTDKTPCAESWELSFHQDGLTKILNGQTLAETTARRDWGDNTAPFPMFPVLIKFIDAKDNLSVQVHPSDDYALKNESSFGKTEMWYIVEAEAGAGIYLGFNRDVTKEEYATAIKENRLTELLNFYEVKAGECYFIPAGTIHAIGRGCLICEIQQNSNLTYRVYDYGRKDKNGNERELHVEKALTVTSLAKHVSRPLQGHTLGASRYFTVKRLCIKDTALFADEKTFQCITCIQGQGEIDGLAVQRGDSFFVPANYGKYTLKGDMQIILTEVRQYSINIALAETFIKGCIVDDLGNVLTRGKVPAKGYKDADGLVLHIADLCGSLLGQANMTASDIVRTDISFPEAMFSDKKNSKNLSRAIEDATGLPVRMTNANAAAFE